MSELSPILTLRQKADGHALYVMGAAESFWPALRQAKFGILATHAGYHREHPHSAYLTESREAKEGARRTQTLILPTGSLKRSQEFREGQWQTTSHYCSRPHHWAKLGLHLTDLTAVAERYAVEQLKSTLSDTDLVALPLPPTPTQMLLEFCPEDFLVQSQRDNTAAVKKARRQLLPFAAEATRACLSVAGDCLLDLSSPLPEALQEPHASDRKKLAAEMQGETVLAPVLAQTPEALPEGEVILLPEGWTDEAEAWLQMIQAHPAPLYLVPFAEGMMKLFPEG